MELRTFVVRFPVGYSPSLVTPGANGAYAVSVLATIESTTLPVIQLSTFILNPSTVTEAVGMEPTEASIE